MNPDAGVIVGALVFSVCARLVHARLDRASRAVQSFSDRLGILRGHAQQRERRTVRRTTPLLPVAQRRDTDADHERKFTLRRVQPRAHRLNIGWSEHCRAAGFHAIAANAIRLPHTRDQLPKCCCLHLNSSRTSRPSMRAWAAKAAGAANDSALLRPRHQRNLQAPILVVVEKSRDDLGEDRRLDEAHSPLYAIGASSPNEI